MTEHEHEPTTTGSLHPRPKSSVTSAMQSAFYEARGAPIQATVAAPFRSQPPPHQQRRDDDCYCSDEDDGATSFSSTHSVRSDFSFDAAGGDAATETYSFPFAPCDSIAVPVTPMLRSRANSSSSVIVVIGGSHTTNNNNNNGSRSRTTSYTDIEMQQQMASSPHLLLHGSSGSSFRNNQRRNSALSRHMIVPAPAFIARASNTINNGSSSSSSSNNGINSVGRIPAAAITAGRQQHLPTLTNRMIEWMQSHRVPTFLARKYYTSVTAVESMRNDDDDDTPAVYWISGLDRVFGSTSSSVSKSASCADAVRLAGVQPPRYLWYMLSGALCDVVQLTSLATLYTLLVGVPDRAALCWCLAFVLSIPVRHVCHRYLVFGDYVGGYRQSLLRMYAGYSVTIVLSTVFNFVMARTYVNSTLLDLSILTMLWTGVANYFILRYFWKVGAPKTSGANATAVNNNT